MIHEQAIYMALGGEGFEFCQPVDHADFELLNGINGAPQAGTWKPIAMTIIDEDAGRKLAKSDSPWLGSNALVLKPKAIEAMGDTLLRYGEILPLEGGGDLAAYNATRVLADALDEQASTITWFRDGRIMMVRKYVFRPEVVEPEVAFRVSNMRVSPIFFSRRFVEEWKQNGLQGLEFTEMWSSRK